MYHNVHNAGILPLMYSDTAGGWNVPVKKTVAGRCWRKPTSSTWHSKTQTVTVTLQKSSSSMHFSEYHLLCCSCGLLCRIFEFKSGIRPKSEHTGALKIEQAYVSLVRNLEYVRRMLSMLVLCIRQSTALRFHSAHRFCYVRLYNRCLCKNWFYTLCALTLNFILLQRNACNWRVSRIEAHVVSKQWNTFVANMVTNIRTDCTDVG